MRVWSLFLACAVIAVASAPVSAAILAQYNFETPVANGAVGTGETNDAGPVAGLSVSTLDRGLAATFFVKRGSGSDSQLISASVDNHVWSVAGSIATETHTVGTSNYLTFTLTPAPLTQIDLTQLSLRMGLGKTGNTGPFELNAYVYTSLDGFASSLAGSPLSIAGLINANEADGPIWTTNTLNLSALGTITAPITFRLYFTDGTSTATGKHGLLDTLTVEGSVTPIPEPGTWAGLAFTGLALAWRKKAANLSSSDFS